MCKFRNSNKILIKILTEIFNKIDFSQWIAALELNLQENSWEQISIYNTVELQLSVLVETRPDTN